MGIMSITLLNSKMLRIGFQSIGKGNATRSRNQIQQLNYLKNLIASASFEHE